MLASKCTRTCLGLSAAVAILSGFLSSQAAGSRPEPLGTVTGIVQAILALNENPNQIFLSAQNPGADCGRGTPASVWKLVLDPTSGNVIGLNKKQDLSKIQNTRNTLFEAADGTLLTGGGWCLYKPPYFSTDGGETWQPADAGPVHPPNSTFSFAEFKGHVYAGTGYEPHHGQVYRWLGGGNWKRVLDIPPPRSIVHRMVVHKNRLFVGSSIYGWHGRGCEKSVPVYVSSDGETFESTTGIPPCCTVQQMLIADGQLIAWVNEYGSSTNRYVYSFNGDDWTKTGNLPKGIHANYAAVFDECVIFGRGQLPDDDRPGLYVSTDLGLTWKQLAVFEGISALHAHGNTLYLAAKGDEKDTSQLYRVDLSDLRAQLAQGCACRPAPAKPPQDIRPPRPAAVARVFVELRGGWSAVGRSRRTTHFPLQTSVGKLQIPLTKIRLLKMQPDGKSAVVELSSGDRLAGTVEMKDIRIETSFGTLNVPFAQMRTLRSVANRLRLPESLRRGLVLHFDFERFDGERVIDQSDHGNHGTLRGAAAMWDGKAGRAVHLKRGDYVNVPTSSSLDLQKITLSAWVRMAPGNDNYFWIQKGEIGGSSINYGLQISPTRSLWYYLADASRNHKGGPTVPISAEKWVHVACTYDGAGEVQLYVDGQPAPATQQKGSLGSIPQRSYSLKIGAWGSQRFQGDVDEVMVYNRVLSPDEIRRLHGLADDVPQDAVLTEPPGKFQLDYAGLRWDLLRTGWKVEDGKLASQRHVRPGFQYGHWANGRGGIALTGNGDKSWVDYEIAFDYKMLPANREFFHAYIPGDSRGMSVVFRAKSVTESWNQPRTCYSFGLRPTGNWGLSASEDWHMPGHGWSATNRKGKTEKLAGGKSESCKDASQGRLRLRVNGNTITVWLGDEQLVKHTHKGDEVNLIPYGGFGVGWRYESMGWISNLEVKKL